MIKYNEWKRQFLMLTEDQKIQSIMDSLNKPEESDSFLENIAQYLQEKKDGNTKQVFYVMRTHSHTDRQQLWKVMSRPIKSIFTAESELDYHQREEKNKEHQFFLVSKDE